MGGDEEVVEAEVGEGVAAGSGVRSIEMSEVQSEAVGDGEDVVEEVVAGGCVRIRVVVREIKLRRSVRSVQGRCVADGHCRSHNTAAECCVTSGARALEFSDPVSETGLISGDREAGFTVWGC